MFCKFNFALAAANVTAIFDNYEGGQRFWAVFCALCFLFMIGSVCGWIIEVLFRRFFSAKKWINPGFLTGPYLPLYGFGVAALFSLCLLGEFNPIPESVPNAQLWWDLAIILFIGVAMTAIEFVTGLIFVKGANIRLWDYSRRPGNIDGIICPLFSAIWTVCGAAFYFLLFPTLAKAVEWFLNNQFFLFFVGIFFGVMLVDLCHSINLAEKLKKIAKENKIVIRFEKLKESIAAQLDEKKVRHYFSFPFRSPISLKEHTEKFVSEEKTTEAAKAEATSTKTK